jgi:predicted  nucleic acid-binding Zn-ribbon protein
MSTVGHSLRELHDLRKRTATLRESIERGPRQLDAKRKHLADRTAALEKARTDLKHLKVKSHERETERKAMDNRINQLQLQINTAKSNKEYTTLVSERDTAAKARAVIEDEILEMLMREDEVAKQNQAAEAEVKRLEQDLADVTTVTEQQGAHLSARLSDVEGLLAAAEEKLPQDAREVYRRLVDRRGPESLAPVSGGICTGCYTGITPQMQNQLLLGELVVCKSCGRMLYLEEAPVPAVAQP